MNNGEKAKKGLALLEKHMEEHKLTVQPFGQLGFMVEDFGIGGPAGTTTVDMFFSGDPETGAVLLKLKEKDTRPKEALAELKHLMSHLGDKGERWSVSLNESECSLEYKTTLTYRRLRSTDIHVVLSNPEVDLYRIAAMADAVAGGMSVKDALDEPWLNEEEGGLAD